MARPPTVQDYVLTELRRAIVAGELRPGRPIRQESLAASLGVSRVPVREALKVLEGEGQVVHRPHHGYAVAELSLADLREVYLMRELLESEAARTAVVHLTDAEMEQVVTAQRDVAAASAAGDLAAMTEANRRFHFAILGASRLPRLVRVVRSLWDATDAYRSVYYNAPTHRETVEREHAAIVAALRARDAARLVALLAEHRDHAVAALTTIISDEGTRP
ncbi:HTH-type transcriptional regulator McbR [Actinomadura rubteroloni]|uniref:HTH-type transcriptional regulator McbR n=1 Tax=Actinomadura rubteroloni TaxID=1926885 RepID=A0A2P4UCD6_9ACTN|nr:GntR family transcriptional regulator [Actinomadura rubteroloni]POM22703.1 HTH-type transcriptional regulator McbR [Actinomadura rubteroloni]